MKFDKNKLYICYPTSDFKIIIDHIKENDYSQEELDGILLQIKEIFDSDGSFDMIEQQSFYMLEKLLKA